MRLNSIPKLAVALVVGLLISGVAKAADTPATLAGTKLAGESGECLMRR